MFALWIVISVFLSIITPQTAFASSAASSSNTKNLITDALVAVPTNTASPSANTGLSNQSNSNLITTSLITNFKAFDSFLGGFIFNTPDLFGKTIQLTNDVTIPGFGSMRFAFAAFSSIIGAFILLWKSGRSVITMKLSYLQSIAGRILFYAFALITIPLLLSYSIQATNLLNQTILPNQETLTKFITDYYTNVNQQVTSGTSPDSFWIPNTNIFSLFNSITHEIMMNIFFIISIIAVLFGIAFIVLQFALRLLTLIFLSIIYPLTTPFLLSEETEGIFYSYLKVWFTMLIHQPAFCLGYLLILIIVRSILATNGASIGLLFLYVAALFFLGTINVLASRIFADALVAIGANLEAGVAAGALNGLAELGFRKTQKYGGKAANWTKEKYDNWKNRVIVEDAPFQKRPRGFTNIGDVINWYPPALQPGFVAGRDTFYGNPPGGSMPTQPIDTSASSSRSVTSSQPASENRSANRSVRDRYKGRFSKSFRKKGFFTKTMDEEQGIVSLTGEGYGYYDSQNDLTYLYPSKNDVTNSGLSLSDTRPTKITREPYIDLSFYPSGGNPHNAPATKRAIEQGKGSDYAHIKHNSEPKFVKGHMEMNQERFEQLGVKGVIIERFDNIGGKRSLKPTQRLVMKGNRT